MRKLSVLLLAFAVVFALPLAARAENTVTVNMSLTWSNGSKMSGTVVLTKTTFDANNNAIPMTVCTGTFNDSGKASCSLPLLLNNVYTVNIKTTNPSTNESATIAMPFIIPSWLLPNGIAGASYTSIVDTATNAAVVGRTHVSVTY